ncbi:FAD-dependent oxidoreductase [Acuticoccus kandeliae]|uniref:FAD-dependent oxidoreductase n=1 Tax=Acuticoccus kandeliae TaxID=2073160 RepID=UPI000D3E27C6|nr:NAD(P)/FAD-dependent oxidoreductase [Acuticoccus kandeliae]
MIIVVGAGIAGLSAALALSDANRVLVLERRAAIAANAGAGIQLSPNAVKALRAIGAEARVDAIAARPNALAVYGAGERRAITRLPYDARFEARFGAPYLTASRAALHTALLTEAEARPSIEIRYDCEVERVAEDGSAVRLAGEEIAATLVIAADGVNSRIRQRLVGDSAADTGWIAWRGKGRTSPGGGTELVLGDGHHVVRYALTDEDENCVLVAPEAQRTPEALATTSTGPTIADVADWAPWPMRVRPRHIYESGGVAFVGDAAHAMLPFLAQGGAMAIEDAAVLGAMVRLHGVGPAALGAYAAARRPRTQRLARQTVQQGRIYHMPAPLTLARDFAMRQLGAKGILARVDWIYRWAPPAGE